ncbi:MAG: YbaB/EbfC family nucleoid-associated protein [Deltaproteobacteria bacterium]|nr:YbaB/EbfC family nucleoid-associated protein [Deltaproteobacteria bacterium]
MGPGGGMNELVRQAARLRRKMDQVREELKDKELSAASAGGKITVTVSCDGKLRSIAVDEAFLVAEGLELALEGVVAAANAALSAAEAHVEGELSKVTGGISISGITG